MMSKKLARSGLNVNRRYGIVRRQNRRTMIRLVWCRQLYTGVGACVRRHRARQGQSRRRDELLDVRFGWTERFIVVPQRSMNTLRTGISMPITKTGCDHCVLNLVVHDDAVICRADGSVIPNAAIVFRGNWPNATNGCLAKAVHTGAAPCWPECRSKAVQPAYGIDLRASRAQIRRVSATLPAGG